ncbi:MAG: hypothetical protein K6F76_05295 [Clostridiales bacterium]|nr:hypothetical protein [Clostridiales bacterium]
MTLFEKIDFLIFPPRCLCCGNILKYAPSNKTKLKDRYDFECTCDKCAPFIGFENYLTKIDEDVYCYSVFEYAKQPKSIIISLKFNGYRDTALQLARILAHQIEFYTDTKSFDCITYVPSSFSKLRKRGFNQAELVAKYIGKLMDLPCEDLLKVNKKPDAQHTLRLYERETNVKDAFKAKESLDKKQILLIDDIVTTGNTLKSCARALKSAGAESVYCATVCKTLKR